MVPADRQATMKLIRCTKKVLDELGLEALDVEADGSLDPCLGEWYCNLRRFFRRRAFLFTHAETLFSFWVADLKRADAKDLGLIFSTHLAANLTHEGFSQSIIRQVTSDTAVQIGKTVSRSVLGSMNEFAFESEYRIARAGGLQGIDLLELNKHLHRTLLSPLGMKYPIERLTQRLTGGAKVIPIAMRPRNSGMLN
jgi:hypothetical protein